MNTYERRLTPQETENYYTFSAKAYVTITGGVWATSQADAYDLINRGKCDIENYEIEEMNDIEDIKEE